MHYLTQNERGMLDMQTKNLILKTLIGLLATAIEKVCVIGEEDAQEDLQRLREVYEDLVLFWGLDEKLIDEFDEKVVRVGIELRDKSILYC